jgi:hypothetical protein
MDLDRYNIQSILEQGHRESSFNGVSATIAQSGLSLEYYVKRERHNTTLYPTVAPSLSMNVRQDTKTT